MKEFRYVLASLFWAVLFFPLLIWAQENYSGEWIRVQSDNGEFSIEVPTDYGFYGDKNGFLISRDSESYQLSEMRMLNAYHEKTLLSFEAYKTASPKAVADIIADREEKDGKESEIKLDESKFRQILIKKENLYAVRRYLTSKSHLYVLTAASRNGETPVMKRFLDSLAVKNTNAKSQSAPEINSKLKIVPFAALKLSQIEINQISEPPKKNGDKKVPSSTPIKSHNSLPIAVITKPNPSFTESARQKGVEGSIRVRLTFSRNGSITKIGFLSTLKEGLLREVMFAAIRMKYVPAEKDGEPVVVTKLVEYAFHLY